MNREAQASSNHYSQSATGKRTQGKSYVVSGATVVLWFFIFFQIDSRNVAALVPAYHVLRFSFLGILMLMIIYIYQAQLSNALKNPVWLPLILMNLFQLFSALWSESMFEGFFWGGLFFLCFLAAIAIGASMSLAKILDLYVKSALYCTLAGVFLALFVPSWGVESKFLLAGDWRGLANQKNLFGYFSGIGFAITLLRALGLQKDMWRGNRLLSAAQAAFFFFSLLMSGSRGGMFASFFTVIFFGLLYTRFQRKTLLCIVIALVFFVSLIISLNLEIGERGVTIFGTYIDASNRFLLWSYGLRGMNDHNLLVGYGRSGFWTTLRSEQFVAENNWVLENFHNGYITLLVEGGIIGFTLFVWAFISILMDLMSGYSRFRGSGFPIALAITVSYLLYCGYEAVIGRSPTMSACLSMAIASCAINAKYSTLSGITVLPKVSAVKARFS